MTSDIERRLDEINCKLQVMIENSYLAKLDLMVSILMSFTIFGGGLLINNLRVIENVYLIAFVAFFPVLVFTLAGEVYSILKDDVATRFGFWLVLLSNLVFLAFISLYASLMFFDPFTLSLSVYIFPILGYVIIIALIYGLNRYLHFFWKYLKRFPTRFQDPSDSSGRETRKLLKPVMAGVAIYVASFLILLAYSFFFRGGT